MQPSRYGSRIGGLLVVLAVLVGCTAQGEAEPSAQPQHVWPPQVGQTYPDLELRASGGDRIALSSFRGKVILVEPVGMDCPACNAFSGAHRSGVGGFQGTHPQRGLPSLHEMLEQHGVAPDDDRLVIVQILFYDMKRKAPPSLRLARRWTQHFGLGAGANEVVLVADDYLIGPASFRMIPGFQLVDSEFRLRFDATGHQPRHDLWRELLPALSGLLAEVESAARAGA
jgi:hypothetical protein